MPSTPPPAVELPDDLMLEWLHAKRGSGDYPIATERAGAWLVAIALGSFEHAWAAIRAATEAGRLGPRARVVPVGTYRLLKSWASPQLVIEVTTYDASDKADVWRVRQAIRDLGITAALTYLGIHTTTSRVVRYSSGLARSPVWRAERMTILNPSRGSCRTSTPAASGPSRLGHASE